MNPVVNYFASFPSLALKEGKKNTSFPPMHTNKKILHVEGIITILNFCVRLVNREREKKLREKPEIVIDCLIGGAVHSAVL